MPADRPETTEIPEGGALVIYSGSGEVLMRLERLPVATPTAEQLAEFEALRQEVGMGGIAALITEALARKLGGGGNG